jgi:hypothetical protein
MSSPIDTRAKLSALVSTLSKIKLLERDKKRIPIVGQILGSFIRSGQHGARLGEELRRAYDGGASIEDLEKLISAAAGDVAAEGETLEALIASWPARDEPSKRPVQRVDVRLLPRGSKP